ncbi:hypothetical protein GCM10027065_17740 [Rhodanobacter koreensis]
MDGHRTVPQHVDALGKAGSLPIQSTGHFLAQALRAHAADALPQEGVRQVASFGETQQPAGGVLLRKFVADSGIGIHGSILFGNQGNSIDVLR